MPLGAVVAILKIMFFALARIGSTAMNGNTTDGHVVKGVAGQVNLSCCCSLIHVNFAIILS